MSARPHAEAVATAADTEGLVRIGALAEAAGVPVATVRHYLREGLLPEPVKTSRNMAYYPPELADRIVLIKQLQEERFLPLRVIREILEKTDGDLDRARTLADTGVEALDRVLAPESERVPASEILERLEIPERALERLSDLGVLSPDERGYAPSDVRILEAIARFRSAGWNEQTGFRARDVARLMKNLEPVIDDEVELLVERLAAVDPERALEMVEGGATPFPDLIGAMHAKLLMDRLERRRSG